MYEQACTYRIQSNKIDTFWSPSRPKNFISSSFFDKVQLSSHMSSTTRNFVTVLVSVDIDISFYVTLPGHPSRTILLSCRFVCGVQNDSLVLSTSSKFVMTFKKQPFCNQVSKQSGPISPMQAGEKTLEVFALELT